MRPALRRVLLAALALGAQVPSDLWPQARLDPDQIGWQELSFRAKKLTLTARSGLALRPLAAEALRDGLLRASSGEPIMPSGEVLELTLDSHYLGRDNYVQLWLDPRDGAALQRVEIEVGKKRKRNSYRSLRYTTIGVSRLNRFPQVGQMGLPSAEWSEVDAWFENFEAPAPVRAVETSGLFYVVSAVDLEKPGDSVEVLVYSKGTLLPVAITFEGFVQKAVHYREHSRQGERAVEGRVTAMRISLGVSEAAAAEEAELELAGLRGRIEMHLDPKTRIPFEFSGKLSFAGRVKVKLREATLR